MSDLQSQLQTHLSAVGMKAGLSAGGFADWVRRGDSARAQAIAAENEKIAAAPVLDAAELLRNKLAGVLNAPEARLDVLVSLASKAAASRVYREYVLSFTIWPT